MTTARTVTEEPAVPDIPAGAPVPPRPVHPMPPVVIPQRRPVRGVAAPVQGEPPAQGEPSAAASPRRRRRAEARVQRRLFREKVLVVLALLVMLGVTLLLLGMQWLGSATPSSSGPAGAVTVTHPSSSEGGS